MALPAASSAAILRAAQKDEYFTEKLANSGSELLRLFGNKLWHQYSKYIPFISHLTYNSLTTLRDLQTFGEEYTGIVQVDDTYSQLPGKFFQTLCILLGACGEKVIKKILQNFKLKIMKNKEMLPGPKRKILKFLSIIHWSLPVIQELHQAYFFLGGYHYNIPKRLMLINYVAAVPGRRPPVGALRSLGVPYLLRAILSAIRSPPSFDDIELKDKQKDTFPLYAACPGCLENNTSPSALPCGHVLCFKCSRSAINCGLCRAPYLVHRVIPLQNYAMSCS